MNLWNKSDPDQRTTQTTVLLVKQRRLERTSPKNVPVTYEILSPPKRNTAY